VIESKGEARELPTRIAYETARLRLARYQVEGEQTRAKAAAHATQVSAEALGIERVGVWLLNGVNLACVSQYVLSRRSHDAGETLPVKRYPRYIEALKERRVIAAEDARSHPLTKELATSYLEPMGITSMLDAPIIRQGHVIGVVCHEHIGAVRTFTQRDLAFATSVADMVTLVFEQADRLELEAALQDQAEQRLEAQKMEALGRMARAVAHDFNNLLGSLGLAVNLLARSAPASLKSTVDEVMTTLDVGRRLTHQLITFGRTRDEVTGSAIDPSRVIEALLPLLRSGVGKTIGVRIELQALDARIKLDPSQLEQVLLNLCLNARDAMNDGGIVTIRLREPVDTDEVAPDHVVLEVADNGVGMNDATTARVFEPFFTTKPHGTGLGLATVYGIVTRAGGTLRATSAPGQGTTMLVSLPRKLG
jgi:signal transduction histidine kinase